MSIDCFRFKWDSNKFEPDFSIIPEEGYISSGMEVPFELSFHPQDISQDIRYEVRNYAMFICVKLWRVTAPLSAIHKNKALKNDKFCIKFVKIMLFMHLFSWHKVVCGVV